MHAITTILCIILADQGIKIFAICSLPPATNEQLSSTLITFALQLNNNGFGNVYSYLPYNIKTVLLYLPTLLLLLFFIIEQKTNYFTFTWKTQKLFILLLAGSISNLLDRFFYQGRVIDYIAIGTGALQTGYFNFADICILIAAFGFGFEYCSKTSPDHNDVQDKNH